MPAFQPTLTVYAIACADKEPHLRAYFPNAAYPDDTRARRGEPAPAARGPVPGLVLVALGHLQDQELFLNYRYNANALGLPDWYAPVDAEEDRRRWA